MIIRFQTVEKERKNKHVCQAEHPQKWEEQMNSEGHFGPCFVDFGKNLSTPVLETTQT